MDLLDPAQLVKDIFHGTVRALTASVVSRLLARVRPEKRPGGAPR
jgi:hypothetical protein